MTLTLYGSPKSRTQRVLWMATELGLSFEHVAYEHDDPALKQPDFLRLNPAGAIPTLTDGEFTLSESLAINLYLAKTYQNSAHIEIYPTDPQREAQTWQWSLWAQYHLEPWIQKDLNLVNAIKTNSNATNEVINQSLDVLNTALASSDWLVSEHFTVADLNVAAVLSPSRSDLLDIASFTNVESWLSRCYSRPACLKARSLYAS